ncbi:MAG: molybdopterin-dependent oxidoreductase [Clostridia bacterium]|nr:molybdopterin-dependent oxidoreductase [Clostridia bacterium]
MATRTVISDCMLCVWDCGIKAHLEDGRLVKVEGLPEHPVSWGYICPRGEALPDYLYAPNRLLAPRRKIAGRWQEVSWEDALNYCAARLAEIKDKYGARSLAIFCGSVGVENLEVASFARRFKGAFGTPNLLSVENICYRARILARQLTFGRYPLEDPRNARTIVLWGHNPDGAKGMLGRLIWEKLEKEELALIVIDPRLIPLAERAVLHLALRPGTDAALALAMLNVIIKENLIDQDFVNNYTVGFESLVEHVKPYTPAWAQEITWVPAESIEKAARLFAQNGPSCIIQGVNSLDQHRNGFQNSRALALLQAVTGNFARPGSWVTIPRIPLGNLSLPDREPPLGAEEYPIFSSLWGRKSPYGIATLFPRAVLEGKPYPIKAALVTAANPVVSFPAAGLFKQAFASLDFLAVFDPFFTETAELAQVVLPACTFLEKGGISYVYGVVHGLPFAQIHQKVVEPLGESRPDWWIWSELARRLGLGQYFPWQTEEEVLDALLGEGDFKERLKASPQGIYYGEKEYYSYEKKKLATPSGKVELYSKTLEEHGYDPLPSYLEPAQSPVNTPELYREYPLILISGARSQAYTHTQLRGLASLKALEPEPLAEMHPETAARYGLKDGDRVRLETKNDAVMLRLRTTPKITPGVVSVPHGWAEANVNLLTDLEGIDPVTAYPDFKAVLCRVKAV